jgi:hypothetical protein
VTRPKTLLKTPEVSQMLAEGEPVAVLLLAILHVIPDNAGAYEAVRELRDALPRGSYLAISHVASDAQPDKAERVAAVLRQAADATWRNQIQVIDFFGDMQVLMPGVVYASDWRPAGPHRLDPDRDAWILGGVGYKS